VIQITFVPKYDSVAIIYIMKEEGDMSSAEKVNEYNLAIRAIYDYDYMLKSKTVLNAVREKLKDEVDDPVLNSYSSLRQALKISNPLDTRILEVSIESEDPKASKLIVDAICEIGMEKIAETMDGEGQASLFEKGSVRPVSSPCNKTGVVTYIIVGLCVAVAAFVVFLIIHMFDDRIKTNEEVEEYFGLSILGDIPDANESNVKRYRRYGRYGAYKHYGSVGISQITKSSGRMPNSDNGGEGR